MTLPPIRYPLPTLILVFVVGLLAWRGETWTRPLRSALAERFRRPVVGPPIPSSTEPRTLAGPLVRKVLLLHDDVAVADRPGGEPAAEPRIRLRMFADVFDVWPLAGPPSHYRIGNRRPLGWVSADDVVPWSTRLVVRAPAAGPNEGGPASTTIRPALPVLSWTHDAIEAVVWDESLPWQAVAGVRSIPSARIRSEDWGVWISRTELLSLLGRTGPNPAESLEVARLRTLVGRLSDERPWTDADVKAVRDFLPSAVREAVPARSPVSSSEALARANENWRPEAGWGGISFQFLPISDLP